MAHSPCFLSPLADSPLLPFLIPLYFLGTLLAVTGSVHLGIRLLVNWPPLSQPFPQPSPLQIPRTQVTKRLTKTTLRIRHLLSGTSMMFSESLVCGNQVFTVYEPVLWFVYPDLFISLWVRSVVFSSISVLFNESQACGILIQFYVVQFERFNVSHICYSYPDLLLYSMWAMSVVFLPRSMLFIVSQVLIIVKQISVVQCEPGPHYCKTDLCCSMWARSSLL